MTVENACRVFVFGAGIAGLACALAAAQAGAAVDVFEAAAAPRRIPVHLAVVPNLLRDLVGLALADACVRAGFPYRGTEVLDGQGKMQFEIGTARLAGARYPATVGLTHAGFVDLLHDAATRAAVRWHWNTPVRAADLRWSGGRIGFADQRLPEPDLVVLATGGQDPLRSALLGHAEQRMSLAQAWWYAVVARPQTLERAALVMGPKGQKLLLVPVGPTAAGLAMSRRTGPGEVDVAAPGVGVLTGGLAATAPAVRALAPAPAAGTPVFVRPVRAMLLDAPWHRGNLVCAGECALALPPQFGQSAAAAVEHAVVLKDVLLGAGNSDAGAVASAYTARRWPRARRLYELTTQAARWDMAPGADTDMAALAQQLARTVGVPA